MQLYHKINNCGAIVLNEIIKAGVENNFFDNLKFISYHNSQCYKNKENKELKCQVGMEFHT